MSFRYREELEQVLSNRGISKDDVCLVGSVVLGILGIRDPGDIDLLLTRQERHRLHVGLGHTDISQNVDIKPHDWGDAVGLTGDQLIDDSRYHERFDGLKVLRPEVLFAVKLFHARDVDQRDVRLLERYAMSVNNWDWELLKELVFPDTTVSRPPSPSRLLARGLRFARMMARNPARAVSLVVGRSKRLIRLPGVSGKALGAQMMLRMDTGTLLGCQFRGGEFARYDVLLRHLAVKAIDEGSHEFEMPYSLMQRTRVDQDTYQELCTLCDSFKRKGFLSRYPIPVTSEGLLIDGAHRLACALYYGVSEVPVRVVSHQSHSYGRTWFVEHGFDEHLLNLLDATRDDLFERCGTWFPLILWPAVKPWFDEISQAVRSRYLVKWEKEIHLGDTLLQFTREVYAVDDIEAWKVELKLHAMKPYGSAVRILALEIPYPDYRPKTKTDSYLSGEGERLKKWLRETYKGQLTDYIYDIVCHTGDNPEHNRSIFDILRRYGDGGVAARGQARRD